MVAFVVQWNRGPCCLFWKIRMSHLTSRLLPLATVECWAGWLCYNLAIINTSTVNSCRTFLPPFHWLWRFRIRIELKSLQKIWLTGRIKESRNLALTEFMYRTSLQFLPLKAKQEFTRSVTPFERFIYALKYKM